MKIMLRPRFALLRGGSVGIVPEDATTSTIRRGRWLCLLLLLLSLLSMWTRSSFGHSSGQGKTFIVAALATPTPPSPKSSSASASTTSTTTPTTTTSSPVNPFARSLFGSTTKNVATQVLQGTGEPIVDLNQYNVYQYTTPTEGPTATNESILAYDEASFQAVCQQWMATWVQSTNERTARLRLSPRNTSSTYVDTVTVQYPRIPGAGLGLQLMEVAGGRSDRIGITVLQNVVPAGPAAMASTTGTGTHLDLVPGDIISSVTLIRGAATTATTTGLVESQQEATVMTECLSYDATVAAIQRLWNEVMPLSSDQQERHADTIVLTLKRLRYKPVVAVKLQYPPRLNKPDETVHMFAGENIRHGLLVRGRPVNDPMAKRFDTKPTGSNCGAGGLCRTCIISIQNGAQLLNPPRMAEQQMLQDSPRWRLACKTVVGHGMQQGDVTVRVFPRQWEQ